MLPARLADEAILLADEYSLANLKWVARLAI